MANLTVSIDQKLPLSFEGFVFNELEMVQQHSCKSYTFNLTDGKISYARFILFLTNDEGRSPYRAPFGSIEFDPMLEYEDLREFISSILRFCEQQHLTKISIVNYPFCYSSNNCQMLTYALINENFFITTTDLNFHLDTHSDFEDGLHVSEKRRLKKCQNENFAVRLESAPDFDEMYELIKRNREEKGFPISMKVEELKNIFTKFPDTYLAFSLRDRNKLIASSIGVKVNSKILYYFLPATDSTYKNYSPILPILKAMFDFCKDNKFDCLDLGIATADGVANPGLIKFKQHLGAKPSLKLSFVKNFSS